MSRRLKPVAAAARHVINEANARRLRERHHERAHMDAQAIINQVKANLSEVIAHQAEQLLAAAKQNAQLQSALGQVQQQLQIVARELADTKEALAKATEPKTDGSVSGKPQITEAQSLADLHGLPRPAADVSGTAFMAANGIAPPAAAPAAEPATV